MPRTIGSTVDSRIGENPICQMPTVNNLHPISRETRVCKTRMNKNGPVSEPRRGLCSRGNRTNGTFIAPPIPGARPRRAALNCSFAAIFGSHCLGPTIEEGHRRHRANCRGSPPRIRMRNTRFDCVPPNEEINLPMKAQQSFTVNLHRRSDCRKTPRRNWNCQSTRF